MKELGLGVVVRALKILKEEFSRDELLASVINISNFHRIQGSVGIEDAAEYIYSVVKELSAFDSEMLEFPYSTSWGNFNPVVGWWVKDAELRVERPKEKLIQNFRNSKTLVVSHSPGGEVSAEVVYVNRGDRSKHYDGVDVGGKAVIACGNPFLTYREACRRGASAILLYREDVPYNATPYLSLFLSPEDVGWANALALSISRKTADELIQRLRTGDKVIVRARVVAGFRDDPKIRVVTAKLGDGTSEVHVFAHYCHPGGTVNDNVSGAATLLELAKVLDRLVNRSKLPLPKKHSLVLLWYPEYYGSVAYLTRKKGEVVFGVNLDMIGERQEVTNSTLNFVRPPPSFFHPYEAVVYRELRNALSAPSFTSPKKLVSLRFDTLPYEVGSDHDIYILSGIPAVMINQWPDIYYHTDLDTVDKFDPNVSILIGSAVGSAIYEVSFNGAETYAVMSYVLEYLGSETSWVSEEVRAFRLNYLCSKLSERLFKYLGTSFNLEKIMPQCGKAPANETLPQKKFTYVGPSCIVDLRAITRQLSDSEIDEVEGIMRSEKYMRTVFQGILPLLLREGKTVSRLRDEIIGEVGVDVSVNDLEKMLSILVRAKLAVESP